MRITPRTEAEIQSENLFPPGEFDFEILEAEETTSKAGNEMIRLKLKVFSESGNFIIISDYLLESVAYKLRHACEAVGMVERYESGKLDAMDFQGKSGRLKLRIDKSDNYPDKNGVKDYIARDAATFTPGHVAKSKQLVNAGMGTYTGRPDLDDEIPF